MEIESTDLDIETIVGEEWPEDLRVREFPNG